MDRSFLLPVSATDARMTVIDGNTEPKGLVRLAALAKTGATTVTDTATGKTVIHLATRNVRGLPMSPFVLDWHRFGEIGTAFAEALGAMKMKPSSLKEKVDDVRLFLSWLPSRFTDGLPETLCAIGTDKLLAYRAYLDSATDAFGKPYSAQTKHKRLSNVRTVFTWLQKPSGEWRSRLDPQLRFPQGAWAAAEKQAKPRPTISGDGIRAILMAAAFEVGKTMARHKEGLELVAYGRKRLHKGMDRMSDFKELSVAVAAIEDWFGGFAVSLKQVYGTNRGLGRALQYVHGAGTVFRYLYPGGREMVPFVVLLSAYTAYNADTILGLRLDQIVTNDVFADQFRMDIPKRRNSRVQERSFSHGPARLATKGAKGRAKRGTTQNRSFRIDPNDELSAYTLIENVKLLTEGLRPRASNNETDRLFLFHVKAPQDGGVRSFGTRESETISGDALWKYLLRAFIAENDLPEFGLSSIRASMADAAEQLTGDIRAVQLLLGHVGTDVTFTHYLSAGARKRASESVAVGQAMRHRWVETGGRRDVREGGQGDSLMSATPGMDCFDPHDSPMPGQTAGKMCSAWLACFFCPLGFIRPDDGHGLARLMQLEAHISEARTTIAAERYQAVYVPILMKIPLWLMKFSPAAREAALAITYLKQLPELE